MSEPLLDWRFRAMGSTWRIHHAGGVDGSVAQRVADLVAADEARWSRFRPTSDTVRITRGAGTPVAVAPETLELAAAAAAWHERTGGTFDPLLGADLRAWGYDRTLEAGLDVDRPAPHVRAARDGAVVVDADAGTVRIPAGTELDLGGIGKSWSAVRAAALLADLVGDERLLLDAGGDLVAVRGEHVVATAAGPVLAVEGSGVATSSTERRAWDLAGGRRAHHLLDPRTGAPGPRGTAIVAGLDPVACDVLASCLVLDPGLIGRIEAPAARIDPAGEVVTSPRWDAVRAGGG